MASLRWVSADCRVVVKLSNIEIAVDPRINYITVDADGIVNAWESYEEPIFDSEEGKWVTYSFYHAHGRHVATLSNIEDIDCSTLIEVYE